jgi:phospholipid/cholesterol/gamma-HCH transport system substrate-binding protein
MTLSPSRRNVLVGITVMGSLIVLGWMLLKFGTAPVKLFQQSKEMQVTFISNRTDGLSVGSQVLYRGVPVGEILTLRNDDNQEDVVITARLNDKPLLPANVEGIIRTQSLISGTAAMSLELIGGEDAKPQGTLTPNNTIRARYVGSELIPPSIGTLATELGKTTQEIRDARLVAHLDETVRSAAEVLKSLKDYVDDPKLKENLTVSIANLRDVTETAKRSAANIEKFSGNLQKVTDQATDTLTDVRTTVHKTGDNVDQLTQQMDDRLLQISKLLDSFQSIASKIDKGQGTAGLLINDTKLYESMVDTSKQLNATITDLQRLVEQWEQEGVYLKLK